MLTTAQRNAIPDVIKLAKQQLDFAKSMATHVEIDLGIDCVRYARAIDQVTGLLDTKPLTVTDEMVTLAMSVFYAGGINYSKFKREEMRAALTAVFAHVKGETQS